MEGVGILIIFNSLLMVLNTAVPSDEIVHYENIHIRQTLTLCVSNLAQKSSV